MHLRRTIIPSPSLETGHLELRVMFQSLERKVLKHEYGRDT